MILQKNNLDIYRYHWTASDEERFKGQPTRRTFDKTNGYQVLSLINNLCILNERFTLVEVREAEQKIWTDLPDKNQSEITVFNWLMRLAI